MLWVKKVFDHQTKITTVTKPGLSLYLNFFSLKKKRQFKTNSDRYDTPVSIPFGFAATVAEILAIADRKLSTFVL